MHFIVLGAGAIGGVIGAKMAQAGCSVELIARGEHLDVMRRQGGISLVTPEERRLVEVDVQASVSDCDWQNEAVVLLCVKSQHTTEAVQQILNVPGGHRLPIVSIQNGVSNEPVLADLFERVHATVVNLPAMHLKPGEVVSYASGCGGILDTGCFPMGVDECNDAIVQGFCAAGFSALSDPQVMRWKYAKLLRNLGNILQAALSDSEAAGDIARSLRKEALACYEQAGIDCANRDEVAARHTAEDGGMLYAMAEVPGFERTAGSTWQSVARNTGNLETHWLNGEIVRLGEAVGVPTPANAVCMQLADRLVASGSGPGLFTTADFYAELAALS